MTETPISLLAEFAAFLRDPAATVWYVSRSAREDAVPGSGLRFGESLMAAEKLGVVEMQQPHDLVSGGDLLVRKLSQAQAEKFAPVAELIARLDLPSPIAGYPRSSQAALDLVNGFKQDEERLLRAIDSIGAGYKPWQDVTSGLFHVAADPLSALAHDPRWVAVARTHFQQGFMALNRAILQPARIRLPEDSAEDPMAEVLD